MTVRLRKRVGLFGGLVHLNLSRGGVSVSAGPKGANVNYDLSGRRKHPRATVGTPGTGFSYQTDLKSSAPELPQAILHRLTPQQRLLAAVKDRSLPLRERAIAFRDWMRGNGNEEMVGSMGLAVCADMVLRGDGASFEERLRNRTLFAIEIMTERGDAKGLDEYSMKRLMEELRSDFAAQVAKSDAENEPLDTSPFTLDSPPAARGSRKLWLLALIFVPLFFMLISH